MTTEFSTVLGNFILVTLSFAILILLIRLFAWKNLTAIFEQRADRIAQDLDEAAAKNETASQLVKKQEDALSQSRMEGKTILHDAVERAKVERKHLLAQTQVEIQTLKEKAKLEIEAEKREANEHVREQVVSLAVDLAGKIILEDLSAADHEELTNRYLDKLGER